MGVLRQRQVVESSVRLFVTLLPLSELALPQVQVLQRQVL
jgi:hypothetical protein